MVGSNCSAMAAVETSHAWSNEYCKQERLISLMKPKINKTTDKKNQGKCSRSGKEGETGLCMKVDTGKNCLVIAAKWMLKNSRRSLISAPLLRLESP